MIPISNDPLSNDPLDAARRSGPPWSVELLAGLQAGVYPDDVSARLRAQVAGDTQAMAILAALDTTVDDLSLLPTPRMPERFALRLDAAIAAESAARLAGSASAGVDPGRGRPRPPGLEPPWRRQIGQSSPPRPAPSPFQQLTSTPPTGGPPAGPPPAGAVPVQYHPDQGADDGSRFRAGPHFHGAGIAGRSPGPSPVGSPAPRPGDLGDVVSLDAARTRRRRWIGGLGVAAAVVVGATITVASLHQSGGSPSQAGVQSGAALPVTTRPATTATSGAPNALELTPGRFQQAFQQISGAHSGPLTNVLVAAACYAANDIAGPDVLGVTQVTYDGQPASAIAVKTSATGARVVVVGLRCGVGGAKDALHSEAVTR